MQLDITPSLKLRPASPEDLSSALARASAERQTIGSLDLAAFAQLLEHKPEDMTATAQAGLTLAELQKQLARGGQWLPLDPPNAEKLTVGALLATDVSGPRRFGYGIIRDYVIGIKVALADGRLICCGGRVVKNVAGYDLAKLFIGSRGSLGVILEVTFKLRPLPEAERFVQAQCESLDKAGRLLEAVLNSELTPIVLDLHKISSARPVSLVVGFAGTREEVDWQVGRAAALGLSEQGTLDYEREFWQGVAQPIQKISVLPSRLIETLEGISAPFVARAGNGVVYYTGAPVPASDELPTRLCHALKQVWDPQNILPPLPL